jgi:hypothetical protein
MLLKGVLTRVLPFFLTFAAGLFIASFFISIATPSFNFPRRANKCRETRQLRTELERVRRDNTELRRQLDEAGMNAEWTRTPDFEPSAPPPPPPPTRKHRVLLER